MSNSNDYINSLMQELEAEGVVPVSNSQVKHIDDMELRTILKMEQDTGVKYSEEQRKILNHHGNACILACAGSGKALANGTNVLTTNGYRPIERLRPGDRVFDAKGYVQVVLGVYPQGFKQVWKMQFKNANNTIKCCRDHLWTYIDTETNTWTTNTTKYIKDNTMGKVAIPALTLDEITWLKFQSSNLAKLADIPKTARVNEFESNYNYITSIEETQDFEEMTCIMVSGLSQLFLTEHCVVTHNTTVSTHLIVKRIMTGEIRDVSKLIYTTYSKEGSIEMKTRLDAIVKQLGLKYDIQVRTLHSFFLQVLRTFGVTANTIEDDRLNKGGMSKRLRFVKEACADANLLLREGDLATIDNLLSYQVNKLLSDVKTVDSYVNTLEDLTVEKFTMIRQGYSSRKATEGLIDYDDMQNYLYLWLVKFSKSKNETQVQTAESVRNYCKAMWTDFYIDEAQDVSKIQFEIIKSIVTDPKDNTKLDKGLVIIGDDDQSIYQWRGGDPSIILGVGPMFNMSTFVLSTNYRCKESIVNFASTGIKCNNSRYPKDMKSNSEGGEVKIAVAEKEDLCSISIIALNNIKKLIENGEKQSEIVVLSRNNFHLSLLSNMLLREGIYCKMASNMKLTKSRMYKDVKDLINLSEVTWKPELTANTLYKLCRYMSKTDARIISGFQDNCALSLVDTLEWIIKHFIDSELEIRCSNNKLNVPLQTEEKLSYYIKKMSQDTCLDMYALYKILSGESREETLKSLLYMYINTSEFMYKTKDKNRSIKGLILYINNLIKKDGIDKMLNFLRATEQLEQGRMAIPGEKITLSTMHTAKGREWNNVIMFASDNVSQPSFDNLRKMINDGIPIHDIFNNIDEERRLFYVGNTRAKNNLLLITYKEPSIFILESLGIFENKKGGNNATILELVENDNLSQKYSNEINSNILDTNSRYYYSDK